MLDSPIGEPRSISQINTGKSIKGSRGSILMRINRARAYAKAVWVMFQSVMVSDKPS